MKLDKGTPKTLREAIDNGIDDAISVGYGESTFNHVKDFIAQKFTPIMLRESDGEIQRMLQRLYEDLTKS